jgi:nitrite reductase (NO-forming)
VNGFGASAVLLAGAIVLGLTATPARAADGPVPNSAASGATSKPQPLLPATDKQMKRGKKLYAAECAACHQPDGTGVAGEVPPLAGSDFLAKGSEHAIGVVLHGLKGTLKVHGRTYHSAMPTRFHLSNEQIADVLTYVYNSWGNPGGRIKASDVAAQRYDRALAPGTK